MLFCLCENNVVVYIQIDSKSEKNSTVIDTIINRTNTQEESTTTFNWLPRMMAYVEGTNKGKIRVKSIDRGGECMFMLSTDFTEPISNVYYN